MDEQQDDEPLSAGVGEKRVIPEQDNEILPLAESSKEQIKLRASFLNGLAIAIFAVGTLAPLIRGMIDNDVSFGEAMTLLFLAIFCLLLSGVIHSYAYRHLKELDQ